MSDWPKKITVFEGAYDAHTWIEGASKNPPFNACVYTRADVLDAFKSLDDDILMDKLQSALITIKMHQDWRRGCDVTPMESPHKIGEALDVMIEACEKIIEKEGK